MGKYRKISLIVDSLMFVELLFVFFNNYFVVLMMIILVIIFVVMLLKSGCDESLFNKKGGCDICGIEVGVGVVVGVFKRNILILS